MAKYKSYDYSQKVFIPVSLEDQLMPGTLEFATHTLVETPMDLSVFDERYNNDDTGRSAYDPKVLFKVVLLAYSRGIISSRKIERVCRENVTFMDMSCGQYPDHSTIASFVSSMADEILPLFRDVLLVCEEMKLLGDTFFALDGCKLPSNASKEYSGTLSDLKKKKADRIGKWLKDNNARIGTTGKELKSNITDNESAKMMTAHGTIQGYNGQAMVDSKHQVIVHNIEKITNYGFT